MRDILIATVSDEQTQRVISAITASGMEVLQTHDTVFEVHRGGKIHSGSRVETGTLRDLRSIYTPGVARVARAIELTSIWRGTSR